MHEENEGHEAIQFNNGSLLNNCYRHKEADTHGLFVPKRHKWKLKIHLTQLIKAVLCPAVRVREKPSDKELKPTDTRQKANDLWRGTAAYWAWSSLVFIDAVCSSYCSVSKAIKFPTVSHISSQYEPYGVCNESVTVNFSIISVLHEIIMQLESSGSGTTGNQLLSG